MTGVFVILACLAAIVIVAIGSLIAIEVGRRPGAHNYSIVYRIPDGYRGAITITYGFQGATELLSDQGAVFEIPPSGQLDVESSAPDDWAKIGAVTYGGEKIHIAQEARGDKLAGVQVFLADMEFSSQTDDGPSRPFQSQQWIFVGTWEEYQRFLELPHSARRAGPLTHPEERPSQ